MTPESKRAPLVAIVGPTASGKSTLAVFLAARLRGEVLACDSTQLYRRFDIGTAKPSAEERRSVPHHLLDLLEPQEVFTAGDYRRRAIAVLEDLAARHNLPFFTVGAGLYFRALLDGLADAPARSEDLRQRLRRSAAERGTHYLHRMLEHLDASAAARIAPRDEPKLIRAIEITLLAGKPATEVLRAGRAGLAGYRAIKIGLRPPRAALNARIEARVGQMLDSGWVEEVRRLMAQGIPADAKPFQFIGYSELAAHLRGEASLEAATRQIQQATRRYAKRQLTWFRRESQVEWLDGFGDADRIQCRALEYLQGQLPGENSAPRGAGQGV